MIGGSVVLLVLSWGSDAGYRPSPSISSSSAHVVHGNDESSRHRAGAGGTGPDGRYGINGTWWPDFRCRWTTVFDRGLPVYEQETNTIMEILLFTLNAIIIYLLADWVIRSLEKRKGQVLKNRQIVFFAVFLALALISFNLLPMLLTSLGVA